MIKVGHIKDLEKQYMDQIWSFVSGEEFLLDLKKIEDYIKEHYFELDRNYQIKNKLKLAAERLLHFYVHKTFDVMGVYPSPISSDIAFFTKDCLINIDAKTIDLSGNRSDDSYIQFCPHQISFENKALYSCVIGNFNFEGATLNPGLPKIEPTTNLPCLTYFMGITYKDDGANFMISHVKLSCIPNGEIVKEDYNNDVIQNFKTYRYLKVDAARKVSNEYIPKNIDMEIPKTWLPFNLQELTQTNNNVSNTWLDTSLKDPFDESKHAIWRVLDKKYHVCLGGDTARIKPNLLENRIDGSGNEWKGIRKMNFR